QVLRICVHRWLALVRPFGNEDRAERVESIPTYPGRRTQFLLPLHSCNSRIPDVAALLAVRKCVREVAVKISCRPRPSPCPPHRPLVCLYVRALFGRFVAFFSRIGRVQRTWKSRNRNHWPAGVCVSPPPFFFVSHEITPPSNPVPLPTKQPLPAALAQPSRPPSG